MLSVGAFSAFYLVEIGANVLCFDMADRNLPLAQAEVRRAAGDPLRFVHGNVALELGFEQMLQSCPMRVLGGVVLRKVRPQRRKVVGEGFHFQRSLSGRTHGRTPQNSL